MENTETEFLRHIFVRALITGEIQVHFDGVGTTVAEVIEGKCYQTLQQTEKSLMTTPYRMRVASSESNRLFAHLNSLGATEAAGTILDKRGGDQ